MLRSFKELQGYSIRATDGDLGRVYDVYFERDTSRVRYFVVETGPWLIGKKVLISPVAIRDVLVEDEALVVELTQEQVKESPDWDVDRPISRQDEIRYHDHYRWPYYWGGGGVGYTSNAGFLATPPEAALWGGYLATPPPDDERAENEPREQDQGKLHSAREVVGYSVESQATEIGTVDDFLILDDEWAIRYFIVDTGTWLSGRKSLVSPEWVESVDWTASRIIVDLHRDALESAPEYDADAAFDPDYERQLYEHYGRRNRWQSVTGKER